MRHVIDFPNPTPVASPLKPTLRDLIHLLRHRELWPPGFEWNYPNCSNCAMGLAARVWPETVIHGNTGTMMEVFGLTREASVRAFLTGGNKYFFLRPPPPERIANYLELLI